MCMQECTHTHTHARTHACTHASTHTRSTTLDIVVEIRAQAATNETYSRKQETSISRHILVDVVSEVCLPQSECGTRITGDRDGVGGRVSYHLNQCHPDLKEVILL